MGPPRLQKSGTEKQFRPRAHVCRSLRMVKVVLNIFCNTEVCEDIAIIYSSCIKFTKLEWLLSVAF